MNQICSREDGSFYLFDIAKLKERMAYLRSRLPQKMRICYAVKANPFLSPYIREEADRFEVCSPGEAEICCFQGIPAEKTVISGVYKTPSAIREMLLCSDDRIFTVESMTQYRMFCSFSQERAKPIPLLLRLTNDSQFGMNQEEIEQILTERNENPELLFLGIQFFSGTQKFSAKKIARELEKLDAFLTKLRLEIGYRAEELEYGTGFPVAYFQDEDFPEEEYLSVFRTAAEQMENRVDFTIELGRSIAAECGSFFTPVVDLKCNRGQNYLLTDGGMHQLSYFGQHMAMRLPFYSVVGKEDWPKDRVCTVCGSLCSMNDLLMKQAPMPAVEIGDFLRFEKTGAYSITEGTALFLSRDLPAVYIRKEDGCVEKIRDRIQTASFNRQTTRNESERMLSNGKTD